MPTEHSEKPQREKPKRGLSSNSTKLARGYLPKARPTDCLPKQDQRAASWDFEDGVLQEQRRCGFIWSDDHVPAEDVPKLLQPGAGSGLVDLEEDANLPPTIQESKPSARPEFTDFRADDSPIPNVFGHGHGHGCAPAPGISAATSIDAAARSTIVRPKSKGRTISFTKTLLSKKSDTSESVADKKSSVDADSQRDYRAISKTSGGSVASGSLFGSIPNRSYDTTRQNSSLFSPMNSEQKANFEKLSGSDTMSSIEEWLGLKKNKPDLKLNKLAQEQKPEVPNRRASFVASMKLPRISSFRTEREHRELNKKINSPLASPGEGKSPSSISAMSGDLYPSPRKERPNFFRALSKKSMASLGSKTSTPNVESAAREEPFAKVGIPEEEPTPLPKSPGKHFGGLLWQSKGVNQNDTDKGPFLARSRRTGSVDDDIITPMTQVGGPDFKTPNHGRPRMAKKSSSQSQISPRDISEKGTNQHYFEPFSSILSQTEKSPVQPPTLLSPSKHPCTKKGTEYLPGEARRVNTPPICKPGKGNRLTGYFWEHWYPGMDSQLQDASSVQVVHTPFPMPQEASVSQAASPQDAPDFYMVRADRIMADKEPRNLDELRMFDWDVPDHLPSSPLCPANPRNKNGGNAVCVYHGKGLGKE